ncbi:MULTISPECIES: AraC family transcriptional regulator [unclassified Gluconobacter]|uniref:helix-turn-helix domain-containing protein n=1 Tax=unclassified Gluconobacter TaxID=2644261 RepID=UPI001C052069|nr:MULTISPECIES: helix-turn-helix transcriptional regulator [unclassified Gluconobacter]
MHSANIACPWLTTRHISQPQRRVTDLHIHKTGQIIGVERGVMIIKTEESYWLIGPRQFLWVPPKTNHEARSHGAISGWSFYLREDRCIFLPTKPFIADSTRLITAQAERLSVAIISSTWDDRTARLAASFWDELLSIPRCPVALPAPKDVRLKQVTEALSIHPADTREQQDWAKLAGMSLRSFVRHFTADTGMSFSTWRQRLRILSAQEKLARGESVTSVAAAVGYESLGAFAAAFRKNTGYSPSDYTKRLLKGVV